MADALQLTLCPDASLRTKMVAASTARAQIRPSGIARLTSRVVFYTRDIEDRSYASGYVDTYIPPAGQADQFFLPRYTGFKPFGWLEPCRVAHLDNNLNKSVIVINILYRAL